MAASRRVALVGTFALGAFVVMGGLNWAQNEINVSFHAFQDTRGVTVLSPTVDLTKDFTERTGVRIKFGVDAITAASDSCARCHASGAGNSRRVASLTVVRKFGDTKVSVGGEYSKENFYQATTGLVGISRDLNKGNTTVAGGFSYSFNQPQLHPAEESMSNRSPDAYLSVTQTVTKTTVVQAGYEYQNVSGFQTSPFLRTPVNGTMVIGNVPDSRTRHTLTARIRQALPGETYLEADYRRYHDTWQVDSDALSIGFSHHFNKQWLGGFGYRYYNQTGASFYRPSYTGSPLYYTGDFRLEPFRSGTYTARVMYTPDGGVFGLRDGSGLYAQYDRYRASNSFDAGILSIGLRVPF